MEYNFREIEKKWQKYWEKDQTFKAENNSEKPKYYVLDMFPYPSGAGLHVGHPLGYIASDIYARYKRLQGFNVLHPMGYDSFGLPAEQYAIQTGQHPAITTKVNIDGGVDKSGNKIPGYEKQLKRLGLSFDWSRKYRTSDATYYKWTQWIFIQLYEHYFCNDAQKARPISELIEVFSKNGNTQVNAACDADTPIFSAEEWQNFSDEKKQEILLKYRLTYLAETEVNWCPELGTVLANDEVVNGVSERGGYPVIRKKMKQWSMRISAYAERLLQGLENIDWTDALKDTQRNWIGKSHGASVNFQVKNQGDRTIEVFTTRPDTIFGVTFMVLAPEHELVKEITTEEYRQAVEDYIFETSKRSERERMAEVKRITGQFTGAYAIHPITGAEIPIWIGDYVLAGYGTGAVMAVPAGDQRDYDFAKYFNIPIPNIFQDADISTEACDSKEAVLANSDFLNGLSVKESMPKIIEKLEEMGVGKGKVNYRLRDAVFSRQRYWGEPFPVYYVNELPQMLPEECLPLVLPEIDEYLPTEDGDPPLGRAKTWAWDTKQNKVVSNDLIDNKTVFPLELNTMPGWAGSSWYFLRYMDANNDKEFVSKEALEYWQNVDLYLGGSEHATGHLLYSRFWHKFLYDCGLVPTDEYAKKLINQGMIQGVVESIYLEKAKGNTFTHHGKNKIIPVAENEVYNIFRSSDYKSIDARLGDLAPINITSDLVVRKGDESYLLVSGIKEFIKQNKEFKNSVFVTDDYFLRCSNGSVFELFCLESQQKIADFTSVDYLEGIGEFNFKTKSEIGKMSKRWRNVVNPDDICEDYGADALRLYEMFLGPIEQSKPWNTQGLSGVSGFIRKLWRLFHNKENEFVITDEKPTKEELKVLHQTIKKVQDDMENFSFNTSVSHFMIAVNELTKLGCNKREILEPLVILVSSYAPHLAEELWEQLGHEKSVTFATFPKFEPKHLQDDAYNYPVSFNGKMRFKREFDLGMSKEDIEASILADEDAQKWLDGKTPKKFIFVKGKIINVVI